MTQEHDPLDNVESAMADVKKALQEIEEKEAIGQLAVQGWKDYAAALDRWQAALAGIGLSVSVPPAGDS